MCNPSPTWKSILQLQNIGQSLVHLGDLGGDAEVDGAVADFNDETADHVGVDLGTVRSFEHGTNGRAW